MSITTESIGEAGLDVELADACAVLDAFGTEDSDAIEARLLADLGVTFDDDAPSYGWLLIQDAPPS